MRKIFLLEMISNAIIFVMALIVSFLPIAKIGTSSIGNSWSAFAGFFGNFPADTTDVLNYILQNSILILPSTLIIGIVLSQVFILILNFVVRKSERYYYNAITNIKIGIIITSVILLICCTVVAAAVLSFYSIYSLSVGPVCILSVLYIVRKIVVDICSYKLVNKSAEKIEKYKKFKKVENKFILPKMFITMSCLIIGLSVCFIACVSVFYYTGYPAYSTYMLIKDATLVNEISADNAKEENDFYNNSYLMEIVNSEKIHPSTKISYSFNYHFYSNFIEETEEKIKELMPDSDSKNSWEEYLVKCNNLKNDIEIAKELQSKKYMYTEAKNYSKEGSYFFSTMVLLDTNGGSRDEKWGKDGEWYKFGATESLTLSKTEFNRSTDFKKINILAYVTYADGSKRFSVIDPINVEELNDAAPGKYMIKWTDDWGTYEAEITIK